MEPGIQVSSLKPLLTTSGQVAEAFRKMAGLGCKWVQLQWIDPSVPIEVIAGAMAESGIQSLSVQDFYETVLGNFDYYTQLNHATGGTWVCVSRIPERLKSREGLDLFIKELAAMAERLAHLGQKLCFHPVTADFTAVPGMDAVGYLLKHMPQLDICLDLYHLNRNCADMPGFIRALGRRVCMVHFKDSRNGSLVPAGSGDICWTGVVKACLDAGVPWGFVEQETWADDPYECLGQALTWLNTELESCQHD